MRTMRELFEGVSKDGFKYFDPQKSPLATYLRLSRKVSGGEARQAESDLVDIFRRAAEIIAANRDKLPTTDADGSDASKTMLDQNQKIRREIDKLFNAWMKKWAKKVNVSGDELEDEWNAVRERAIQDRKH